LELVF